MKFIAIVIRIPQRSEKGQTHAQWAKNGKNSAINNIHTSHLIHKSKSTIFEFFFFLFQQIAGFFRFRNFFGIKF